MYKSNTNNFGNKPYTVPIEKIYKTFEIAKGEVSGLASRANFVISHKSGKNEVIGLTEFNIIFRYHRAANKKNQGKIMIYNRIKMLIGLMTILI